MVTINFHKLPGLTARLVRWFTRGRYDHVSVSVDGVVFEARSSGVRQASYLEPGEKVDRFEIPGVTIRQEIEIRSFLSRQVGKEYDWPMIFAFWTRQTSESRKSRSRWFCSELAFVAFQQAGINLLDRCYPWEVSPAVLSYSPLLRDV